MDSARHWKRRWAYSCLSSAMPSSIRSYVSSKLFGNSFKARRILDGRQRLRTSSWQTAQRNLHYCMRSVMTWLFGDNLHPVHFLGEHLDNHFLVFVPPLPHLPI